MSQVLRRSPCCVHDAPPRDATTGPCHDGPHLPRPTPSQLRANLLSDDAIGCGSPARDALNNGEDGIEEFEGRRERGTAVIGIAVAGGMGVGFG